MKKVYIVLTYTGTVISKLIHWYTKDSYAHSSISLDKNLNQMYSFGRLNPYTPLFAGFVHEYIDKGTFKRFHKTITKVYELPVTDEQYLKIANTIKEFYENKTKYKFNILGLYLAGLNIKVQRKNHYYCAEFVNHALLNAGIDFNLPKIIKPIHLMDLPDTTLVYEGLLQKYSYPAKNYENFEKTLDKSAKMV